MNVQVRRCLAATVLVACFTMSGASAPIALAADAERPEADRAPVVQIAILLDNSGSMRGLINQARSELWKVVNEFVDAKLQGKRPDLQVAVYHYGNPPATQLVPLTGDLDRVSEALFGIPVSGGSEYCGAVIQAATEGLQWSDNPRDLRMIFIAGNEPFTQGPVDYKAACKAAIAKGIMVNTIHCGPGTPDGWADGALLADGKAISIDHNQEVVHIPAPQDKKISDLGVELNKTYIAYGAAGKAAARRQTEQDANAQQQSIASGQQRALAKANRLYRNAAWDLCDACKEGVVDLSKIDPEMLPENMRKMSIDERKAYVNKMRGQREKLQEQINLLNTQRLEHVAAKRREQAEKDGKTTLDEALITAIRDQATKKQFEFDR